MPGRSWYVLSTFTGQVEDLNRVRSDFMSTTNSTRSGSRPRNGASRGHGPDARPDTPAQEGEEDVRLTAVIESLMSSTTRRAQARRAVPVPAVRRHNKFISIETKEGEHSRPGWRCRRALEDRPMSKITLDGAGRELCPSCAPDTEEVNHPVGMTFVREWGHG